MKRVICIALLLGLVLASVSAGGRTENEPVEISGTVSFSTNASGDVIAVISTPDGDFKLNIPPEELVALELTEGQELTVYGYLVGNEDTDPQKVVVLSVTDDGETYEIKNPEKGLTLRERLQYRNHGEEQLIAREENQVQESRPDEAAQKETRTRKSRD
jgi:hypothetical protein